MDASKIVQTIYLVVLYLGTSFTAPQQGNIETIAEVKPTIFDYPAAVYDDVPEPYSLRESQIINGGRQDFSSDDFNYDITTENIEVETTEYTDAATYGYGRITETVIPTDEYEARKKTPESFSKVSYYVNTYLVEDKLNDQERKSIVEKQPSDFENKLKYDKDTRNDTSVKLNNADNRTIVSVGKLYNDDGKLDVESKPNMEGGKKNIVEVKPNVIESSPNYAANEANIVENKPNYAAGKPSYFSVGRKEPYSTASLLQKAGRRKFRSNCRCEKIWNCPKLQITVPRCPDEYFMCCF